MNLNKIIGILMIFCIATTFISAVSAVELVDIEGVKFNIPDGYEENVEEIGMVETANNTTIFKYYFDHEYHGIAIGVMKEDNVNLTLPTDMHGYETRTIKGIEGFYDEEDNIFAYEMDGKLVEITTTDVNLLEDVIVP